MPDETRTNARLPLPGPHAAAPAVTAYFDKIRSVSGEPINIHHALAYVPDVLERFFAVTGTLRTHSALSRADQEIAILRTLIVVNGEYELVPHQHFGKLAGLTDAQVSDIETWQSSDAYDERQRALLAFMDQSLRPEGVDDDVFAEAVRFFPRDQLMAALLLSGMYATLAQVTRTFKVPSDADDALRSANRLTQSLKDEATSKPVAEKRKYLFMVFPKAVEGREAEFNHWYDGEHLPDILRLPGFVAGQRFEMTTEVAGKGLNPYLTVWEVETDDLPATRAALAAAADTPAMSVSDALDRNSVQSGFYVPMGARVAAAK